MNQYLEILEKIKSYKYNSEYRPLFEKIELYVKGEITSEELVHNTDNEAKGIIYFTINKIIGYDRKDIRYYIKLPEDMFFNTMSRPCILVGQVEDISIKTDHMKVLGPNYMKTQISGFYDKHYIEITGNFSEIPNGALLYRSDWYRIISKYPYLVERMNNLYRDDYQFGNENKNLTIEETKKRITEHINKWIHMPREKEYYPYVDGKDEVQYLSQEVIDSIEFVIPKEYISREQIASGKFGTFENILNRQIPIVKENVSNMEEKEEASKKNKLSVLNKDDVILPPTTKNLQSNDTTNLTIDDVVNYLSSDYYNNMSLAISLDMQYLTEKALIGRTEHEKILMLADFILNYKGDEIDGHLFWFQNHVNKSMLNCKILNTSLITLAKLNSDTMVQKLLAMGANDVLDENIENTKVVAKLFCFGKKKQITLQDTISLINQMSANNSEQSFRKK